MLGGILRHCCFLDIEIDDVDRLDIDGNEELHRSLIDMRDNDPTWCINGTRRYLPSEDIGLTMEPKEKKRKFEFRTSL